MKLVTMFVLLLSLTMAMEGFASDDEVYDIKTRVGREFSITLETNPTTGYLWQIARPVEYKMLRFIRSEYTPDDPQLMGSGGKEKWTFRAVRPGTTEVRFKYVRPWENGANPARKARYIIKIEKK